MLLQWQLEHFTQAQETTLGNLEWANKLLKESTQEKILLGIYDEECKQMPDEVQELFSYMKMPDAITEEITINSTYHESVSFIKGATEKSSTLPSDRGYDHYKSILMKMALNDNIVLDR